MGRRPRPRFYPPGWKRSRRPEQACRQELHFIAPTNWAGILYLPGLIWIRQQPSCPGLQVSTEIWKPAPPNVPISTLPAMLHIFSMTSSLRPASCHAFFSGQRLILISIPPGSHRSTSGSNIRPSSGMTAINAFLRPYISEGAYFAYVFPISRPRL